jgi:ribosome production factor 1
MGKKTADASLKGKKPGNTAGVVKARPQSRNPGQIKNKLKRSEMYGKYLMEKKAAKRQQRVQRQKEAEELGEDVATAKQTPKTLENTREKEHTMVRTEDEEVMGDEASDEFADYFSDTIRPKILVTTRPRPSAQLFHFIGDLMRFFPKLYYYPRKSFSVKEICEFATPKDFTHLMVLGEKSKVCNGMIISHLRRTDAAATGTGAEGGEEDGVFKGAGPTAFFKISNVVTSTNVPGHGSATSHVPELVLNGFGTRLGHRVGRFLGSLFPHNAQFQGRQVATFHNQRDYIFVRHHRYIFEEGKEPINPPKPDKKETDKEDGDEEENETSKPKKQKNKTKARLQELGPRFTMKLKWIQEGTFDTQFGEYEWFHKRKEMDTTRRKFHL